MAGRNRFLNARAAAWRRLIQGGFFIWCLFLGVQFSLFVHHYRSGAIGPGYLRPAGVEGFLPIGAMMSFKAWLLSGEVDPVHPAALVIFASILLTAVLAKKSFCSWLCPVGTLSAGLGAAGRALFGRNLRPWPVLDLGLRGLKYLALAFFVKLIWIDMPLAAIQGFLRSPYWAVSDVRMLHFFTDLSWLGLAILAALALLSLFVRHAWCRYLCPYGALLGLASLASPLKIRRRSDACSGCGTCSRVCPERLPVAARHTVRSAECSACLTCVDQCPQPGALRITLVRKIALPGAAFALVVVLLFAGGVGLGVLGGHWQTVLTDADFQRLIPVATRSGP